MPLDLNVVVTNQGSGVNSSNPFPTKDTNGGNGATGVTIPTGGLGILGWLSGIYNRLAGVVIATGSALIGSVTITANAALVSTANPMPVALALVSTSAPSVPTVFNVTLTDADTEYSQALPADTKKLLVSIRSGVVGDNYRIAFVTGKVATPTAPYVYLTEDLLYSVEGVDIAEGTLYLASSQAAVVAEITAWT